MASLRPSAVAELADALRGIHGRGEKLDSVDLGAFSRVLEHTPEDMTVTVESGLSLAALQSRLSQRGQWLPIDPPRAGTLTIADLLNDDRSGPRRFGYGTIREHLLGLQVVLADGRVIRNGGKVVKNVAGYDLCKLFVGARGTLGVIVEATFKLRPRPEAEVVVTAPCASPDHAARLTEAVLDSELTPIVLDLYHLAPRPSPLASTLVLAFAGTREEVEWQLTRAAALGLREPASLDYETAFWDMDTEPRRLSVLPSRVAGMIPSLGQAPWVARAGNGVIYHRSPFAPAQAGNVLGEATALPAHEPHPLTPSLSPSGGEGARRAGEGAAAVVQGRTAEFGSGRTLPVRNERGEGDDSGALNTQQSGLPASLLRRIKDAYDPKHVFPELTL